MIISYRSAQMAAASKPAEFEVVAPNDPSYLQFLTVCSAIIENKPGAAAAVLDFAASHRVVPYRAALLNTARLRSAGEVRRGIDEILLQEHSGDAEALNAQLDLARINRWRDEDARARKYESELQAELRNKANEAALRDLRKLGTITRPEDFAGFEAFLRDHPRSFFAPIVLQRMITAVESGILPPSQSPSDLDAVAKALYLRLLHDYPESYFALEAKENPNARRVLDR